MPEDSPRIRNISLAIGGASLLVIAGCRLVVGFVVGKLRKDLGNLSETASANREEVDDAPATANREDTRIATSKNASTVLLAMPREHLAREDRPTLQDIAGRAGLAPEDTKKAVDELLTKGLISVRIVRGAQRFRLRALGREVVRGDQTSPVGLAQP